MGKFGNISKVIDAEKMNEELKNPLASITDACIVKHEPDYYEKEE